MIPVYFVYYDPGLYPLEPLPVEEVETADLAFATEMGEELVTRGRTRRNIEDIFSKALERRLGLMPSSVQVLQDRVKQNRCFGYSDIDWGTVEDLIPKIAAESGRSELDIICMVGEIMEEIQISESELSELSSYIPGYAASGARHQFRRLLAREQALAAAANPSQAPGFFGTLWSFMPPVSMPRFGFGANVEPVRL